MDVEVFIAHVLGADVPDGSATPVEVTLVHRPDNEFDPNAVSVSAPPAFGGSPAARHLGYIYEADLYASGGSNLSDLAEFSGGSLTCTALAVDSWSLVLDLPDPVTLRHAVDNFLSAPQSAIPGPYRFQQSRRPRRTHTVPDAATALALERVWKPLPQFRPPRRLEIRLAAGYAHRSLQLFDPDIGNRVGEITHGHLNLGDPRSRPYVVDLLLEVGIETTPDLQQFAESDSPHAVAPNIGAFWRPPWFDLDILDVPAGTPNRTIALYNPDTSVLCVQDSRLVPPALAYAQQVGYDVADLRVPKKPWHLHYEVPISLTREEQRGVSADEPESTTWLALRRLIKRVTDGQSIARHLPMSRPGSRQGEEPMGVFLLHERFVGHRNTIFPGHHLTGEVTQCRICGAQAASFFTPVCTGVLAYCASCLDYIAKGIGQDRSFAAGALRRVGRLEFDGAPMLESQLDSLHIEPKNPITPDRVDELVLLRIAIRRNHYPWTHLLVEAGLAGEGIRSGRGVTIAARDGHICLSLGEKAVCDFLHQHGVSHQREPRYPTDHELNTRGARRADWLLADGTFVELWGMPDDDAYAERMHVKRRLVERHGLRLLELTYADLPRLPDVFREWVPDHATGATKWLWSPRRPPEPR